ncbi:hypothetical protein [Ferrovibrio xuzhouensis]|uniref:Uncharacterized protein n=1 Tax=Ferrovibrio xuzhouensis TaxID=1576914 RepID=A0ABV7VB40_9PROT
MAAKPNTSAVAAVTIHRKRNGKDEVIPRGTIFKGDADEIGDYLTRGHATPVVPQKVQEDGDGAA